MKYTKVTANAAQLALILDRLGEAVADGYVKVPLKFDGGGLFVVALTAEQVKALITWQPPGTEAYV